MRRLAEATEKGIAELRERQTRLEEGIAELRERQMRLEEGIAELRERQMRLEEGQIRLEERLRLLNEGQKRLGGLLMEQTAARRLMPRIIQTMNLTQPRTVRSLDREMPEDIMDALYSAADAGSISLDAADGVMLADFIMAALSKLDRSKVFVVAEISSTLNRSDIERAKDRAAALESATGTRAMAAVAATITPEPQLAQADRESVAVFPLDSEW